VSDYLRQTSTLVATPGLRWFVPYFQMSRCWTRARPSSACMANGSRATATCRAWRCAPRTARASTSMSSRCAISWPWASGARARRLPGARARPLPARARAGAGCARRRAGALQPEQIVDGTTLDQARLAARAQLNARLAPHGIVVAEIPAATPRFDAAYEQQGLRRRVAEQQIALIGAERAALEMERVQRLTKPLASGERAGAGDRRAGEPAHRRPDPGARAARRRRAPTGWNVSRRPAASAPAGRAAPTAGRNATRARPPASPRACWRSARGRAGRARGLDRGPGADRARARTL